MSDPQVTLFSDSEYRGSQSTLSIGRYPSGFGISNDALSSLKIPAGLKVTLCEHGNFEGRRCTLIRDTPSLKGANDKTSSIIVERLTTPTVIVYSDSEFAGWSAEVPVGSHSSIPAGNDLVSSVIVPAGHRVTLYKDGPFKGDVRELTRDAASLDGFNDAASSMIVDRLADRAPTFDELKQIIEKVGPRIYFHPDDTFGPSSVEWFLKRATLHQKDGPTRNAGDAPLPAGGGDDGLYWLECSRSARGGDLGSAVAYVNAKYQNSWLDLQFWIFYPYNGAGSAKVSVTEFSGTIGLDPMGQHGGDWEHVTCRVDPVTKELRAMYLAQHGGGEWVPLGEIPMENGRPVAFSSRNGHASYRGEGTNLSNDTSYKEFGYTVYELGLVNSTKKGSKRLDCNARYQLLRADFLTDAVAAPDWTQYCRRWGPRITYKSSDLKASIKSSLGNIPYADKAVDWIYGAIPDEAKEENGPTGPWMKGPWKGGE
ncbi:Vps62-related protein [Sorangium sp. So ce131]|uniref:Vps62-related protein n=1 Tax=Sorangium sp. So ce131 TaxID=3133282 RepID=UPI003F620651